MAEEDGAGSKHYSKNSAGFNNLPMGRAVRGHGAAPGTAEPAR